MASLKEVAQRAWAPKGYLEMMANPEYRHLSQKGVFPETVDLNKGNWEFLHRHNSKVNKFAAYRADLPGWDTWGVWTLVNGLRRGDCDDYAVAKLDVLIKAGWPRGALRLAVCRVAFAQTYHCVLLVYGSKPGQVAVLDSRSSDLFYKNAAYGYEWISEEHPGETFWWRKS